jgi:predicted Ser/Thr protein kinase
MTCDLVKERLRLPDDVLLIAVRELSADSRRGITCSDEDYVITRPHSRTPSKIVDSQGAALLREFHEPRTVVEAVIRHGQNIGADPDKLLEDAFPMLQRLLRSQFLVPADSERAKISRASLQKGSNFCNYRILSCLQLLDDTEVYQVTDQRGRFAALKILRYANRPELAMTIKREAAILKQLDGRTNPKLLRQGAYKFRSFLLTEWCAGSLASAVADELRQQPRSREKLFTVCGAIIEAYVNLHSQGILHSDVHPRNILVSSDGTVKILDYGLSRLEGSSAVSSDPERGGVSFFLEPEYASAALEHKTPPASSKFGEQYALAALIYS